VDLILHVAAGVAVGIFSAIFGVGGGVLIVPYLVFVESHGQHLAEGTSLLVIVPTAVAAVVAHARRGRVAFRLAAWLGAGGILGAVLGASLAHSAAPQELQKGFGIFLILVGIQTIAVARRPAQAEPT
jgi:uncharacterized membrane protein YfcA